MQLLRCSIPNFCSFYFLTCIIIKLYLYYTTTFFQLNIYDLFTTNIVTCCNSINFCTPQIKHKLIIGFICHSRVCNTIAHDTCQNIFILNTNLSHFSTRNIDLKTNSIFISLNVQLFFLCTRIYFIYKSQIQLFCF